MLTKDFLKRMTCVLLALILCIGILSGCRDNNDIDAEGSTKQEETRQEGAISSDEVDFDLLMDELFADWVTSDSLSMNYFLADPYSLDIERPETTYGEVVTAELIQESKEETQELADRLAGFNYQNLRVDQKVVYDILMRNISLYRIMEQREDFSYYTGYIRPLNGIQVQLPVLLAEYNFYTAEDIERYLELLADTHRYFSDIIEYERERSRRGFFLNEANVDSVIEQIESYLENREDNLLITVFDDRIDNYAGLSNEQRESFKERNRELVLENVLVAYDTLLAAMKELRGVGAREGGLANLPGGSEYAHALLRLRVGTDRSIDELADLLEEWVERAWNDIIEALHGEAQLIEQLLDDSLGKIHEGTPESYIAELQRSISADFPHIDTTRLTVLEVHESLQEHMSPAFYLAPAVDRFDDNVVYVNPSSIDDDLFMFTVLAHESYPGHMYQTVYFLQQSPHPVRIALSNTGYSEGWATYAEMMSYYYAGLSHEEATLMWNFRIFDSLLTSRADLGVNLLGWSLDDVANMMLPIIGDMEVVERVYNMVSGIPLNSLLYSLGYIELTMLLNERERALGGNFDLLDFHRYILEFGPAPYPILSKYIDVPFTSQEEAKPSKPLEPAA